MFAPYNYLDKSGTLGVQETKKSLPLGLGSAFAALPPPPPLPIDHRVPDTRYLWDPARLHALHPPAHPTLSHLSPSLELPHIPSRLGSTHLGLQPGELTVPHPTYRIPHYMEHLYQSLHTPPQSSLRGLSPLDRSSLALSSDYLGMSGIAATRLSDPLMLPASLTSTDLSFSIDGSRLTSPRPSMRQSRKRALSSSPYSDSFDINSMIRFSPNSLVSIMNGSRSSSASGSYGHLSAGAISPALGVPPSMGAAQSQLQQLQAHIMRGASIPGSPFLAPSPLLQHSPSTIPHHQNIFSLTSQPQPLQHHHHHHPHLPHPIKPLTEKKDLPTPIQEEEKISKSKKDAAPVIAPVSAATPGRNGMLPGSGHDQTSSNTTTNDDEHMKEEPDDFIETNCNWKDCSKEFNTQDELVKHINNDHIHANKKSFVCRWKECSREEKPFKAQYMLVVHMRRHTGEKPHRCSFEGCFKAYSRLENLKTHLRSHTGEKPYMCEYPGCTKAFSNASDRAKHQNRTHSNEKPYVCKAPGCTKRYTDPSSLRKHVKTVHGADFYASKKHKGNDHPNNNAANGGSSANKDGQSEGSPHSDTGKGSLSSPSVKSEDPTSPGQEHSPCMTVGGTVPMDQSRLFDAPISDTNISTTFDVPLAEEWDVVDDDLEASVDLPMGVGSVNGGNGLLTSTATLHERNLRNRLKVRLQTKGLTNILPNIPNTPPRKPTGLGELSHKINQMKVNGNLHLDARKSILEYPLKSAQTMLANNRRDSNSTVSTYYGSMKSDSTHPMSRRGSEMSQASCNSMGRPGMASSLYDPISLGSSRRSSEVSNYMSNSASTMASQLTARLNRHAMATPDGYNTSNLVVQTQNMSLSQENLQSQQWSNAVAPNNVDSNNSGYFGTAGPLGPPTTNQQRDGLRRSSDPGRPLDRGFSEPSQRMQRYNSYYNANYRGQFAMRPLMTPPIYNNHPALQNDQQNGEIKVENKDRAAGTPNNMYNQPPVYPVQNMGAPYPNQNMTTPYHSMMSPNGYQYSQQSPGYSVPSPAQGMGYNQPILSPNQQQFTNLNTPPANTTPYNQTSPYAKTNNINSCYPLQQQSQSNPVAQNPQYNAQYGQINQQMGRHFPTGPHASFHLSQQPPTRFQNNALACQTPTYGLGSANYGHVHICGHLAAPNLPNSAYQAPCSGCQGRGYTNFDNSQYQQQGDWSAQQANVNHSYTNHYAHTADASAHAPVSYTDPMTSFNSMHPDATMMSLGYNAVASDVQCQDVSQSTQARLADANKLKNQQQAKHASVVVTPANVDNVTVPAPVVDPIPVEVKPQPPVNSKKEEEEVIQKETSTGEDKETQHKGFMKPETYRRTLEYVQNCHTWTTPPVKEEVSSTTDQKPQLNSNGVVVGYNPPVTAPALVNHVAVPSNDTTLMAAVNLHTPTFNTTLPAPLSQVPNMVINDMSSSLTSLQKENKYLQLLQ